MKWQFIYSGFNTGKYNMEYDLDLAKNVSESETIVRFYRWNPYCISLGANQDIAAIKTEDAKKDNIDIVKRPTGGRAILHAEELTYSVVKHINFETSARDVYHSINLALIEGLKFYDSTLNKVELETVQPDFPKFYKEDISALCFAVPAKNELKFDGKKLAGSAQRKLGSSLLQHGSLLCGTYHKNIIKYLNLPEESIKDISSELELNTIEISEILNVEIDYDHLISNLVDGFISHFKIDDFEFNKEIKNIKQLSVV
jgi:lipoate-protein ligase A